MKSDNIKMTDGELVKIIQGHVDDGIGSEAGELSNVRQKLLDRYLGELYGNEKDGQSKIVTREVMEIIEWAMPAVMRVFACSSRFVEFEPEGPEDEDAAEQETDAVNYVYNKDNNAYVTTHTIVKSALLNPNSYVKVYRDEPEQASTEQYENLTDEELIKIYSDQELEIIGAETNDQGLYDLEVKRTTIRGKTKVEPLPEDEVVIDSNWAHLMLDGCPFVCHYPEKTHSELLLMGFDANELDMAYSSDLESSEERNRNKYTDERNSDDESHKALRKYKFHECFMLVDFDGDGIAERRRVVMIGNKIFDNEETDEQPIEAAASILMPHKHTGLSYAQTITDLQDVKTTVMRQLMTNMYRANNPRTVVLEGANIADILANRANGIIRAKNVGDVTTEPVTPIIGQVLPLLDLLDQQKEMRSGVTRNGMGLDADILAKSTEGAFMGALEKADQRIEMLVRTFAETIFKSIALKIHALLIKHGDVRQIKSSGQWVSINPSEWKRRETMTVRVGIGNGDRKQKMFAANMIIQDQDKLIQGGGMDVLVSRQNVYNARKLLTEAAGEVNVDKYYMNPQMAEPQQEEPPQPDANMLMIQANKQIEDGKLQHKYAELQQDTQYKTAQMQYQRLSDASKQRLDEFEAQYKSQIESLEAQISKSKNDDNAENAALQTQIKQLEVQLTDANKDADRDMVKYKADLNAETKLRLKEMDQDDQAAPMIEANQTQINDTLGTMAQLINSMNQPKEIVRDEHGNPIGIRNTGTGETKALIRNDQGEVEGVE